MELKEFYKKLAKNDEKGFFPVFDSENIIVDKTDNGYKVTLSDYTQIDTNEVAYTVLTLCTADNSVRGISDKMIEIYDAPEELIHRDVIKILYDFWASGIITWKENKNFYASLYEEVMNGCTYKALLLKEGVKFIEQNKDALIFDAQFDPDIKFTQAYIEKEMRMKNMRFFQCYKGENLILAASLIPNKAYCNGKEEIISFNIDSIYMNEKAEYDRIVQDDFWKWCISWFDVPNKNSKSFFNIKSSNDEKQENVFSKLFFVRVENATEENNYYERYVEW